jgi:hypothetical protein
MLTVPRSISTSAIEPSDSHTGPSGNRSPFAMTRISFIPAAPFGAKNVAGWRAQGRECGHVAGRVMVQLVRIEHIRRK